MFTVIIHAHLQLQTNYAHTHRRERASHRVNTGHASMILYAAGDDDVDDDDDDDYI